MNKPLVTITEDEFVETYKPIIDNLDWTDEDDAEQIVRADDLYCIWTLIEEDDKMYLTSGMRRVNRLSYTITEEPYPQDKHILVPLEL